MISRNCIIYSALSVILVVYIFVMLPITTSMAANDTLSGFRITLIDSINSGFVSEQNVAKQCGDINRWITSRRCADINLDSLERSLQQCDQFEHVNVYISNNRKLVIEIAPMNPVARVFDNGLSYYVNREGKRISAEPRFHIDVPVVIGHFTAQRPVTRLLPLLDYIAQNPDTDALVSTVKQQTNGDIIVVPTIRGHVINLGDSSIIDNRFQRLFTFYNKVMPVRGWETYDTISVKWRGSIVATRRNKSLQQSIIPADDQMEYVDDAGTMQGSLPDSIILKN